MVVNLPDILGIKTRRIRLQGAARCEKLRVMRNVSTQECQDRCNLAVRCSRRQCAEGIHSAAASRVVPIPARPESRRRFRARPPCSSRKSRRSDRNSRSHVLSRVVSELVSIMFLLSTCPSWQSQPAMASFRVLAGIRGPPAVVTATGFEIRRQSKRCGVWHQVSWIGFRCYSAPLHRTTRMQMRTCQPLGRRS